MTTGILLITHTGIAPALLATVNGMLGYDCENTDYFEIAFDASTEDMDQQIAQHIDTLDQGQGVLILTDLYGSTPSNLCTHFTQKQNVNMISGLNLPMLLRVMNYRDLQLDQLTEKATSGGHDGIREYHCELENKPG